MTTTIYTAINTQTVLSQTKDSNTDRCNCNKETHKVSKYSIITSYTNKLETASRSKLFHQMSIVLLKLRIH